MRTIGKTIRDTDTIYKKSRIQASEFNDRLKSREGAAGMMGVSSSSILNYETGVCKQIPADVVVKMAEVYNAPELMNYYCCNECIIGKRIAPQLEILDMDRLTLQVLASLKNINIVKETLIDIVEDGVITQDEKPKLKYVLDSLDKISNEAQSLKLWAQKNIK